MGFILLQYQITWASSATLRPGIGPPQSRCKQIQHTKKTHRPVSKHSMKVRSLQSVLYVGAFSMGGRAGSRGIVETVFAKCLRITRAADDDAPTKEAKSRPDPAGVQRVSKAHNHRFTVSAHREPDRSHDTTQCWENNMLEDHHST